MKSRLIKFLIVFALILGAAEVFVRINGKYFYALTDKILLKVKILERSPETEVLFIGSSRFLDAIDQGVFSKQLESKTGKKIKSMNGATTGIDADRFAYFSHIAAKNKHLTHVVLEASPPTLNHSKAVFLRELKKEKVKDQPAEPGPAASARKEVFADKFETRLQTWVTESIALVEYRKSLRADVLLKLLVLYTADSIDPNTWSRKGIVRNLFSSSDFKMPENLSEKFTPDVITPSSIDAVPPAKKLRASRFYENLQVISGIFSESGMEVIWVAPPVTEAMWTKNSSLKYTQYYKATAFRYGSFFYDCAGSDLGDEFYRDPTHLNVKGRALFSTVLADQLAEHF